MPMQPLVIVGGCLDGGGDSRSRAIGACN